MNLKEKKEMKTMLTNCKSGGVFYTHQSKKGFTLIELLAVIVILAVIALIATPIIMNIIEDAKIGAMEENKRVMEHAAELFSMNSKNEARLPQNNGDRVYVDLEELENNYMKPIAGFGDKCEGYVTIDNIKNNLDYTAYLDCGDGNTLSIASAYVNYGGRYLDEFKDIITTQDKGILVVGQSNSPNYGKMKNKASSVSNDAIIIKYNSNGEIEWEKNFGGTKNDSFNKVIEVEDGYLVLGQIESNDGDMKDLQTSTQNVMLLKYSKSGKLLKKVLLTKSGSNTSGSDLLSFNGNIYVTGATRETSNGMSQAFIMSVNSDFKVEWKKFYGGTYVSHFGGITVSEDNQLVAAGFSSSTDGDIADIKINPKGKVDGIIYKIDASNGTILNRTISQSRSFSYVATIGDNYLVRYGGNIYLMEPSGNILKTLYMANLTSIDQVDTNKWVYSGWYGDANGKYHITMKTIDSGLNVLQSKDYIAGNSTIVNAITKLNNAYYMVGTSFSVSDIFETFNYGNSDAYLMKLDSNLVLTKDFNLKTILKQQLPELVKNYGDHIPTVSEQKTLNIYTTNDPTVDLKGWCTSATEIDPNSNYSAPNCLGPFDTTKKFGVASKSLFGADMDPNIVLPASNYRAGSWLHVYFYLGNAGHGYELSNLKLTFEDGKVATFADAVKDGYVEPLVISGSFGNLIHHFENSYRLLSGGSSGLGDWTGHRIMFKPKKKLTNLSVKINKIPTSTAANASITIYEYRDFDMSLSPAKDS